MDEPDVQRGEYHIDKRTHAGRKAGAQIAEMRGVGESQMRRAGRWNRDDMTGCYLTSLPFKHIKAMSGLSPKGDYYIPRAQIIPPLELQRKVFPTVDYWLHATTVRRRLM
ncbi:hypothetical protein V1525DRAFT_30694 [Lipomyces kononenkoae]|uniref:Uncharacterized protein n=1 Tax=Lipomyces kononenkoae TaxID=34357 RepID=A0ACC3ST75_LIPKO